MSMGGNSSSFQSKVRVGAAGMLLTSGRVTLHGAAQLHEAHCRFLLIQSTIPLTMVRCPGPLAPPCTWTART